MKKLKYILLFLVVAYVFASCKKFLDVTPVDNLSGNTFWKTKQDVEGFTNGLYFLLRKKVGGTLPPPPVIGTQLQRGAFSMVGDLRCAPIISASGNAFISLLQNNDIRGLMANGEWNGNYNFSSNSRWKEFYDVISSANLMIKKVDEVEDPSFGEAVKKRYQGEAIFLRNLSYFYMVRLFGDVPYYTDALVSDPLPRTPMLTVINNCINDLMAVKNDLPWAYEDGSLVGIRATRGSLIALAMHLNMWAAGFDTDANKIGYYTAVKDLALELETATNYDLLPYTAEEYKKIFKGRTKENLFEFYQNSNLGEKVDPRSNLGFLLSHYPLLNQQNSLSAAYYSKEWIVKIYPAGVSDARKELWFENIEANNNTFQFKKFANTYAEGDQILNDDDIMVFRLSDAYLLAAEANAELNFTDEAQRYANKVRERANATPFNSIGQQLKDDIFYERVRELMGEGQYYYDLVRTKRITDIRFCIKPMSVSDFNNGAWTWPIDRSALKQNPKLTLNNFWL